MQRTNKSDDDEYNPHSTNEMMIKLTYRDFSVKDNFTTGYLVGKTTGLSNNVLLRIWRKRRYHVT